MKYLLLLHGTEGESQVNLSPDEMAANMAPWSRYTNELVQAGAFAGGEALHPSSASTTVRHQTGGDRIVSDGPFAETKEQIGGYYLVESKDLDEALEWAKKVPVGEGSAVEVRPVMDLSDYGYETPNTAASATG